MFRYLILASIVGVCFAADAEVEGVAICQEYAECLEKAQTRLADCGADSEKDKKVFCEEAKKIGDELHALQSQRTTDIIGCIKEKAGDAEVLTGRKAKKCAAGVQKLKKVPTDASKREKRQGKKNNKKNTCAKDARKLRAQCAKIAKCCSVIKGCQATDKNDALVSKKKELKDAVKVCKDKQGSKKAHKGKKGGKKEKHAKAEATTTTVAPAPTA